VKLLLGLGLAEVAFTVTDVGKDAWVVEGELTAEWSTITCGASRRGVFSEIAKTEVGCGS
jgi:hypothetical protein